MSQVVLKNLNIKWIPQSTKCFVCPGQGGQFPGMGEEYTGTPGTDLIFEEASEALKIDMMDLLFNDPANQLNQTEFTAPAMMTYSFLAWNNLKHKFGATHQDFKYGMGHSLGEITAAAIAGSLTLSQGVVLAQERAKMMTRSCPPGRGAMAILRVDETSTLDLIKDYDEISVAAFNGPECTSISGSNTQIDTLITNHPDLDITKLGVSIASHCFLMEPAQSEFKELLDSIEIKDPAVPIISGVTVEPLTTADELKRSFIDGLTQPVHFKQSIEYAHSQSVTDFIELSGRGSFGKFIKEIVP